jgi:hypothetical protein
MEEEKKQETSQGTTPPEAAPAVKSSALAVAERNFKMGLEPADIDSALKLCATIARTGMFGVKTAEDALVRLMTGRALGLPAMLSLRKIRAIEGQPSLDADLVLALCLAHPMVEYFRLVETTDERATYTAKRRDNPPVTLTFTIEEARKALLLDRGDTPEAKAKNNWNRYRPQMLRARCITNLAKIVCPEASMGMGDATGEEEVNVVTVSQTGEVLHETKPANIPSRDYDAETKAFKARIDAATTPADRKTLRAAFESSDIPAPWAEEIKQYYNTKLASARAAAGPAGAAVNGGGAT